MDAESRQVQKSFLDRKSSVLGDGLNVGREGEGGVKNGIATSGLQKRTAGHVIP